MEINITIDDSKVIEELSIIIDRVFEEKMEVLKSDLVEKSNKKYDNKDSNFEISKEIEEDIEYKNRYLNGL